ncbi:DUF3137 domain-containing protein [Sulfurimonas sp. C5]|uniref:DUF3137 domain-containing protein n=1 Tax=Sulfurimonas sp. C5 TaxID=3036947 RepID=UPI0024573796|nr:DUF3137 domain-containing protein [Sulfurimonas sp. C5]MDH4944251.1 DUF3137 domain-containing protein [Sulfurimonas sp. C5]
MKTISELTDFYYKTLYPILQELEEARKHLKSRVVTVGITYTIIFALLFFSFFQYMDIDFIVFAIVAYVALGGFIYKFMISTYRDEFKTKIMKPLILEIDNTFRYIPNMHIDVEFFKRSQLFPSPDRFSGNDLVKGKIDGVDLKFSDLHAEKEYKDSKGRRSYSTIFKGLFIVSDFHKNFQGHTVVLPDIAQNTFGDMIGSFLQSNNFTRRGELIKMDSPEFEKEFVVYGSDQIEARYILTHSLMEKILHYKKHSGHPVYVSFKGQNIYMAIEYNKDLFEPSVFRSLLEYKIAMEYIKTLHLSIGIVEELKLNQKLWSKHG